MKPALLGEIDTLSKDRPTILQIIPHLDTGGAELSVVEVADAIVRAGGRALVLAEPGRLSPRVTAAGGEMMPFPAGTKNPLKMLANARIIARIVREQGVDLIHARSRAPAWSGLRAAQLASVPLVTTYHGAYGETNAIKRAYNSVMARGAVVIANSNYTARLIKSRYATPSERIEVIHRGVDPAAFDPAAIAPERVAALLARWDVAPGTAVILHAARLTGWKGQAVLISAAAKLAAMGQLGQAVVVLAGDAQGRDSYVKGLKGQIAKAGLGQHVRLVGHTDDIAAAYLAAHVTVVASTEPEAFGRSAIEAAAMGCPVIAADHGAPPETILAPPDSPPDSVTGWLVPPGDAQALARQLSAALALEPGNRSAIGGRARWHVLVNFTVQAMQRKTLAVYDRVLGTRLEGRFSHSVAHHIPATSLQRPT